MNFNPHDYQDYAISYIEKHPVAVVLLDMGLGKTSITLTALNDLLFDSFDVHRILVVAPLRVARNTWSSEIKKWEHLQDLQYSIVVGTEKERMTALEKRADIYDTVSPQRGIFEYMRGAHLKIPCSWFFRDIPWYK